MDKTVFNTKAPQNPPTIMENDVNGGASTADDEDNAQLLLLQKRATENKNKKSENDKILSKQLMPLHTIVDMKKKKESRAQLLDDLQEDTSIEGARKRKLLTEEQMTPDAKRRNPNIVDANSEEKWEKPTINKEVAPVIATTVAHTNHTNGVSLVSPIFTKKQIMDLSSQHLTSINGGCMGSDKTTQLVKFLYKEGFGKHKIIGITEPLAETAIDMTRLVAEELNLSGSEVSYLTSSVTRNTRKRTRINFMTDSVLLKEFETDQMLNKYSVIVVDGALERIVITSIVVSLLCEIMKARHSSSDPLKVIIMSGISHDSDLVQCGADAISRAAIVEPKAPRYPVTIYHNNIMSPEYMAEAYRTTLEIHAHLPEGGILIFVAKPKEVNQLVRKLQDAFSNLDDYNLPGFDTKVEMLEANDPELKEEQQREQPLWVLPFHSLLSKKKVDRIFQPAPDGRRLCVVSTNLAEISVAIPHVRYVVDTGREETLVYDKLTGVRTFGVTYTSKASANQRASCAGRDGEGYCYRLYSKAVFNDLFEDFSQPAIKRMPVDELMLQMRCMGISSVFNFPFPSPFDQLQLKAAEQRLNILGAMELSVGMYSSMEVTTLGKMFSRFPVSPRYGKMLALSFEQQLLPYTICLVAALSVQEMLIETSKGDVAEQLIWLPIGEYKQLGDPMLLVNAVCDAECASSMDKLGEFFEMYRLRPETINKVRKLRVQLTDYINLYVMSNERLAVDPHLNRPRPEQVRLLRQILLASLGDQVARKLPLGEIADKKERRRLKYAYNCVDMEQPVFLDANSVLRKTAPEWIVYQEMYDGVQVGDSSKMFIRGITAIEPKWLLTNFPMLCNLRGVREDPQARYDPKMGKIYCHMDATFGKAAWPLPLDEVEMPFSEEACCYFGMFLLDGSVCPQLAEYKLKLKFSPASLINSCSSAKKKLLRFKRVLIENEIYSRQALFDQWDSEPNFLLHEYQNLLQDVELSELAPIWPPL